MVKIKKTSGFSMVEMMLVLAIMGITTVMASYSYTRYVNNQNLRSVARQLESDIKAMKEIAVSRTNTPIKIDFNTAANTYKLSTYPLTGTTWRPAQTKILTSLNGDSLPGVTFKSIPGGGVAYTLTFLSRGLISPAPAVAISNCNATTCSIVIKNSRGSQATISFNLTGKTYVTYAMQ